MHACRHADMHTYMKRVQTRMRTCMHACVYIHIYICIHLYTHTYCTSMATSTHACTHSICASTRMCAHVIVPVSRLISGGNTVAARTTRGIHVLLVSPRDRNHIRAFPPKPTPLYVVIHTYDKDKTALRTVQEVQHLTFSRTA